MCLLAICISSLEKLLFWSSACFFDWVVCFSDIEFYELLHILGIDPLSVKSFENIFSNSVGCLFLLSKVFFAVQKLLSLIRSHLFIFAFVSFALGTDPKKYCCDLCQSILPMFSSRIFMISDLTFRSLIHSELIFLYGVRECSNFIVLHIAVQFSQHHLFKRLSFLHCIFLPPLL